MTTAATLIADALEQIANPELLDRYAQGEHDSLRYFESLIAVKLGGDFDPQAWDEAMELIRERYDRE